MQKFVKTAKFTLCAVYFAMLVLVVMTVSLPCLVIWYVETMHRPQDLATVVMITCYPCVPLAAIALNSAKKLLKRIIAGELFVEENAKALKTVSVCCLIAGLIMLIAGTSYMPFYIAGSSALACTLAFKITLDIFNEGLKAHSKKLKEEELVAESGENL